MEIPGHAYFRGKIVPYTEAKVGVLTHALNYGTAVFGGLRGYWNTDEDQLYIFRPIEHFRRFLNSTKLLWMEIDHSPESLLQVTLDLLRTENYRCDIYIRPLAFKSDEVIGVKLHDLQDEMSIIAVPFDRYVTNDTDAHVGFSSWRRVDDTMIPPRGKISGAYANSAFIKTEAVRNGFDEALVLNQDGHVSEGSAMNIFMIQNGGLVTPPVSDNILEGITRKTILELARRELNLTITERTIDRTEVYFCDEFFMTGTAAQVTAVTRIDHRPVGNGKMGPITEQLRELFYDIVRGKNPRYRHWNVPVYSEVRVVEPLKASG